MVKSQWSSYLSPSHTALNSNSSNALCTASRFCLIVVIVFVLLGYIGWCSKSSLTTCRLYAQVEYYSYSSPHPNFMFSPISPFHSAKTNYRAFSCQSPTLSLTQLSKSCPTVSYNHCIFVLINFLFWNENQRMKNKVCFKNGWFCHQPKKR